MPEPLKILALGGCVAGLAILGGTCGLIGAFVGSLVGLLIGIYVLFIRRKLDHAPEDRKRG